MNIELLKDHFKRGGFNVYVYPFSQFDIDHIKQLNATVLYNSSEDKNNFYKSFIEDIVYHLEESKIKVLPGYSCLKAHNNKVAMELLRERSEFKSIQTIKSKVFGTFEELRSQIQSFNYPVVIKTASGAMSKGVYKADSQEELLHIAKKISRSKMFIHDIKDLLRGIKYRKNYKKESLYRNKFVIQNLVPNLSNDWKVLVYGNRCYALYRGVRKNDFRASGSGDFIFKRDIPEGLLDYAIAIKDHFNVPHISLDIGFDGKSFHLIEFQFLYFGTTTLEKSDFYFEKVQDNWKVFEGKTDLEETYCRSIIDYLNNE